jgi:hypothetical protein
MVMIVVPMQSVPITTKVESSNAAHGEVYSIQHLSVTCSKSGFLKSGIPGENQTCCKSLTNVVLNTPRHERHLNSQL